MQKLSKSAAQIVFDVIAKPRGPSDTINAVIQLCREAGAGSQKPEPPVREPEPEPLPEPGEVALPEDNAAGEGAVATDEE